MHETRPLPKLFVSLPAWLLLVAVVVSLGIFCATYFAYFLRLEAGAPGSEVPLAIGVGSFFLLMCVVAYLGISSATLLGRVAKAAGLALAATSVFLLIFLFLVVNTMGA